MSIHYDNNLINRIFATLKENISFLSTSPSLFTDEESNVFITFRSGFSISTQQVIGTRVSCNYANLSGFYYGTKFFTNPSICYTYNNATHGELKQRISYSDLSRIVTYTSRDYLAGFTGTIHWCDLINSETTGSATSANSYVRISLLDDASTYNTVINAYTAFLMYYVPD